MVHIYYRACFALFWATAVDIVYKLAPQDMKNTCLALLNALYYTIGGAVGNIVWSYVYGAWGIQFVFFIGGFILAVNVAVMHIWYSAVITKQLQIVQDMYGLNDASQRARQMASVSVVGTSSQSSFTV
jgi:hypothetical protein